MAKRDRGVRDRCRSRSHDGLLAGRLHDVAVPVLARRLVRVGGNRRGRFELCGGRQPRRATCVLVCQGRAPEPQAPDPVHARERRPELHPVLVRAAAGRRDRQRVGTDRERHRRIEPDLHAHAVERPGGDGRRATRPRLLVERSGPVGLGVEASGHCFPGSTDPGTQPGQLFSFKCQQPASFVWGTEARETSTASQRF